jgi:UDP-N-acetylglucosamine diphosphorylase/glucosamine-1-phosphate N-acetyltransferase
MKAVFFEDHHYPKLDPLSLSRPACMLLYGTSRLYSKWIEPLRFDDYSFLCRPYLSAVLALETGKRANVIPDGDLLFINGRYLPSNNAVSAIEKIESKEALIYEDDLVAFRISDDRPPELIEILENLYDTDAGQKAKSYFDLREIEAVRHDYLWDLVDGNGKMILREFAGFKSRSTLSGERAVGVTVIEPANVHISESAAIAPSVVIDATEGPVIIENNVSVEPHTYIQGPAYIGPDCRLTGGRIRGGCSFGPMCRVGGEVEETIMLGYCNKYHDGFLGHSYLGEWVNLGAMTTNSDLKNNYGQIKAAVGNEVVNTGLIKVGSFIGDHTKTGIGTMLNTGICIGFSCNLYGSGLFTDKRIRSFSWGTPGNLIDYRLEKAIRTAGASMSRRGVEFAIAHEKLFSGIQQVDS